MTFPLRSVHEREWRDMVIENVSGEVVRCKKTRPTRSDTTGVVRSDCSALSSPDTTCTIPNFVPTGSVPWPEPLQRLRETFCVSSFVGVFPELNRIWVTVDSKLVLWDYRGTREFTVFDEVPEVIDHIGVPVLPAPGVFQDHITYLLPISTQSLVILLGVSVMDKVGYTGVKLVNMGYNVTKNFNVLKIDCARDAGRIFIGSRSGELYELLYTSTATAFFPRVHLAECSKWYKTMSNLGSALQWLTRFLKDTPGGPQPPLRDLVVDADHKKLLTLDVNDTLSVWLLNSRPIQKAWSASLRRGLDSTAAVPARLFVTEPDEFGCTLCIVFNDGSHRRYRYNDSDVLMGTGEMVEGRRIPYAPDASNEVFNCYASSSVVLLAHRERRSGETTGQLTAVTSPLSILPPSADCGCVVASVDISLSSISRIDAFSITPAEQGEIRNELCRQVLHAPQRLIVVHRNGVSFFIQMRPVDTLNAILAAASNTNREPLLHRFAAAYGPSDYIAMALQLACGAVNTANQRTALLEKRAQSLAPTGDTLMRLGLLITSRVPDSVRQRAADVVRSVPAPSKEADSIRSDGTCHMSFACSPIVNSIWMLAARALCEIWELPLSAMDMNKLNGAFNALDPLAQFIKSSYERDIRSKTELFQHDYSWKGTRFEVWIPNGRKPTGVEVNNLQREIICRCYEFVNRATQCIDILRKAHLIPLSREDGGVKFLQVVQSEEVALRLGRYYADAFMGANQGPSSAERLKLLKTMQQDCPCFFDPAYTRDFQARSEISLLTNGESLASFSNSQLASWLQAAIPKAYTYWKNGSLRSLCHSLNAMKREDVSIVLLMHAAAQADPNNVALALYHSRARQQQQQQQSQLDSTFGSSGGESSGRSAMSSLDAEQLLAQKTEILESVISTLEYCWLSHRSVTDSMLGGPQKSGLIWGIEPRDELAHTHLFNWLFSRREDAVLQSTLRDTVVHCRSPFVGTFLERKKHLFGEEYIQYLSSVRGDFKRAAAESSSLSEAALANIPSSERLDHRIRFAKEALRCTTVSHSSDRFQVQRHLQHLEAQKCLAACLDSFLSSAPQQALNEEVIVDGQLTTRGVLARQRREELAAAVLPTEMLFSTGMQYRATGGGEVLLLAVYAAGQGNAETCRRLVPIVFEDCRSSPEDIAKRLILDYYQRYDDFPLAAVVEELEKRYYVQRGEGCPDAVNLFTQLGVGAISLLGAYESILSSSAGLEGSVSAAQILFAQSVVLSKMAEQVHVGRVQEHVFRAAHDTLSREIEAHIQSAGETAIMQAAQNTLDESATLLRVGRWNF